MRQMILHLKTASSILSFILYDYTNEQILADKSLCRFGDGEFDIMAYDLAKMGYQALDIGHIDLEYDWYKNNKGNRSDTPYKYSNETENGDQVRPINDPKFESQIIEKIY